MERRTAAWLWAVPGAQKLPVAILTILQALAGAYGVLYALLLRGVVDAAVGHDAGQFWHYVTLTLLLVAGQLLLYALIRWLNELCRSSLENAFKLRLTNTLLRKDYASVAAVHSGEWLNRLTNDTVVVANGYVEILPELVGMVVKMVSALTMLIVLDRTFAFVLLPGGAAIVVLTYAFRKALKRLHKRIQESDGRLRVFLQERIGSLMMIKAFAAEERTVDEADERMRDHKAARMRRNRFANICSLGFSAAMNGMYLFGVVYCAYGIMNDTLSYGTLVAVMQMVEQIRTPFARISGYLPKWYAVLASAERLREAEGFADDGGAGALPLAEVTRYYREELRSFGFRGARFAYPGEEMPVVLEGLTLDIRKGQTVAFTGHSGCGKSTVLKLLLALYPLDEGERYLDGQPLTAAWRRLFAYVPQGNALMQGSIREAVSFADPALAHDDERLRRALEIACADSFVFALEQGLDTQLGERGAGLSEGQLQRLSIARAILSGNPILLLDEATSALDEQTEQRLLHNLRSLTDKTVLIVTHRPAALGICDRVLHFGAEGVVEQ